MIVEHSNLYKRNVGPWRHMAQASNHDVERMSGDSRPRSFYALVLSVRSIRWLFLSRAASSHIVGQLHENVGANLVDPPTIRGAHENVSVIVPQGRSAPAEAIDAGQSIY